MNRRTRQDAHGLEGGPFIVLSDIFINLVFVLTIALIAVTLSTSSDIKQLQITQDQKNLDQQMAGTFPALWNKTITSYPNGNYQRFTFSDSLFFDPGLWEIKPAARPLLGRLAPLLRASLREKKVIKVVVEGHTDQQPMGPALAARVTDSWGLSSLRAMAVVRYLQSQDVPGSCLTAVGRGEFSPLLAGRSPEAFAKNRRVEIILVYAAGGDQNPSDLKNRAGI